MKNAFQVGDIVCGIGRRYSVTNEDMTEGEVIMVSSNHTFAVHILNHRNGIRVGETYPNLDPQYFRLVGEYNTEPISKEDFLSIFE